MMHSFQRLADFKQNFAYNCWICYCWISYNCYVCGIQSWN